MRHRPLALMLVASTLLVATWAAPGAAKTTPTTSTPTKNKSGKCPTDGTPVRDLRYERRKGVDPNQLSLDVYPSSTGCPAPVVVWVHGGGLVIGDKRNQMAPKVRLLNDLGYTVVSVNYRLTDPTAAEPLQYPAHAEDVAAALAWVHDTVAKYGGDPDRIALLGHSAGAQIVASLATDPEFLAAHDLTPSDLACVAPLDTERFDLTVPIDADTPAHLVVRRGTRARRLVLERYVAALAGAGVPVTVADASGLTHNEVNSRIGAPGDTVMTPPVTAFLADCFATARG